MNPIIKNINILSKIYTYDSLLLSSKEHRIRKDTRYLKHFRPISANIQRIISIIKMSFHNEIILIHLNKLHHIPTKNRISRLRNAFKGIQNLASYYNYYTTYGLQIVELTNYINNLLLSLEQIQNPQLVLLPITNSITEGTDREDESDYNEETETSDDLESYYLEDEDEDESERHVGYITHIKLFVINVFAYISQSITNFFLWF